MHRSIALLMTPTRVEGWTRGNSWTDIGRVVKILLLDEARNRFEAEDHWWREHREATQLFVNEFEEVLRQIASSPGIGQRYRRARGKLIQRVLMKKTRCHVYYFHDTARDVIEIHSIWGARRRRGPAL
jgi:plasmid stabilization system protein ParE